MLNIPIFPEITLSVKEGKAVFGQFSLGPPGNATSDNLITQYIAGYLSTAEQHPVNYEGDPFSNVQFPIYGSFDKNDTIPVAMLSAVVHWGSYLKNVLPSQAKGIVAVIENPCSGSFTYMIYGGTAVFVGQGDFHDRKFERFRQRVSFEDIARLDDGSEYGVELLNSYCPISLVVYPSKEYSDEFNTNLPIMMTMTVLFVFIFAFLLFLLYDRLVERRQRLVLTKALQSGAIVSSLFPGKVAEQILQQSNFNNGTDNTHISSKHRLKSMLNNENADGSEWRREQPIAELFPHTTVLFADIAGFTAWSSTREPTQVFTLLQGVYQAFDGIAKRRRVFKVETIGDSYMVRPCSICQSYSQANIYYYDFKLYSC
jgi:Adenylate and Guanylate cyclase catalytic domain